jgi:hypothetical protein
MGQQSISEVLPLKAELLTDALLPHFFTATRVFAFPTYHQCRYSVLRAPGTTLSIPRRSEPR